MFFEPPNLTDFFKQFITNGAKKAASDKDYLQNEIMKWKSSPKRTEQIIGDRYYSGYHDILRCKRTAIGADGKLITIENLPNNKIVDNQYEKVVTQKVNFLVSQPITFKSENEDYVAALNKIFDKNFLRTFKALTIDCLNGGVGWLYIYYNENGEFCFKRFAPYEILPFWKDSEHTKLDYAVRVYEVIECSNGQQNIVEKVEVYKSDGIEYYTLNNGILIADIENPKEFYLKVNESGYNWAKIPLIPFKYNYMEIPLIRNTKSLQDAINTMLSNFQNNMEEDIRSTIFVLKNYEGENLGEFRQNLATYGAVKFFSDGGLETLHIEVNAENYKAIVELMKKELISNAKGYDAAKLRSGSTPNEMNIKSIFNDINMDANAMEIEFEAGFENLLWFINAHLANTNQGNFDGEQVEIIFNKDTIVNESQVIADIKNSVGVISEETCVANHPWIDDPKKELERVKAEKAEQTAAYINTDAFRIGRWFCEKQRILAKTFRFITSPTA